ncbi:MAG: 30S ribosomal protein S2 [Bauldia sp.]
MALPDFTMRQLLEAGVHFGHQKHRWNPEMASFIFGVRNNIHIIDLAQTVPMLARALQAVSDAVAGGGRILFVGTKRQAAEPIAAAAKRSAQYFVNSRWLGGMLTNWKTISNSIRRLRDLDQMLEGEALGLTKKERLTLSRERTKLDAALGGIKEMGGLPDLLFVIDTNKEAIAIKEATRLGIPVVAILDTNCNPHGISFPIPGNDDAGRAIALYCDLIARAALDGISRAQGDIGADVGASEDVGVLAAADAAASDAPAQDGAKDDLKRISGIGKVLEGKLNGLGVTRIKQIAEWLPEDIARVDQALTLRGRAEREDWVGKAKTLVGG